MALYYVASVALPTAGDAVLAIAAETKDRMVHASVTSTHGVSVGFTEAEAEAQHFFAYLSNSQLPIPFVLPSGQVLYAAPSSPSSVFKFMVTKT